MSKSEEDPVREREAEREDKKWCHSTSMIGFVFSRIYFEAGIKNLFISMKMTQKNQEILNLK